MKKIRLRRVAIAAALLLPLGLAAFMLQRSQVFASARLLDQVLQLTATRYVDTISANLLYEKAARGLVRELNDPYSVLLSPKELAQFNQQTGGKYGGIGMEIFEVQGFVTVQRVFPNTPAARGGVLNGDRIIQIDTFNTRGWTTQQVSDKLKGEPGTSVQVKFARSGVAEPIPMTFERAIVHIPAVPYALVLNGNVGYVPLQQFSETAAEELEDAVRDVTTRGATRLVIDLRSNPGGILDQAISSSNIFLPPGKQVATVRSRTGEVQPYNSTVEPSQPSIPIVLLIDGRSASASEILAGALQDHDRALIVGTTSFGKGLVQSLFQLDGGYALKMTTAKWFTPSGRSIQKARKLLPDGEFVEVLPDSLESDSVKRSRPQYRSDGGRIVYGGGGITPDLIIQPDTLTTAEHKFRTALAPKGQIISTELQEFAVLQKGKLTPDFKITPAMRNEFINRLRNKGVILDQQLLGSATSDLDRILGNRITEVLFGDSTRLKKYIKEDNQLEKAINLLQNAPDQQALFAIAQQETQRMARRK